MGILPSQSLLMDRLSWQYFQGKASLIPVSYHGGFNTFVDLGGDRAKDLDSGWNREPVPARTALPRAQKRWPHCLLVTFSTFYASAIVLAC